MGHSKAHLIPELLQQDPCPWVYQPLRTAARHSEIKGLKLWLIYASLPPSFSCLFFPEAEMLNCLNSPPVRQTGLAGS